MSETADLSSDNERNPPRYPPSSRATSSAYSITAGSPDVIIILDSDDDEDETRKNLLVNPSVGKGEQKKAEETPRAIKRKIFFSFLGHTLSLQSNYHRFTLNLARDSICVWFMENFERKSQDTHRHFAEALRSNQTHLKAHRRLNIDYHLTPINVDGSPQQLSHACRPFGAGQPSTEAKW